MTVTIHGTIDAHMSIQFDKEYVWCKASDIVSLDQFSSFLTYLEQCVYILFSLNINTTFWKREEMELLHLEE